MKTIEFDLEKDQQLDLLSTKIEKENIVLGKDKFLLKIHTDNVISNTLYASFLILLANYFNEERSKIIHNQNPDIIIHDKDGKSYYMIFIKYHDINKLENKIEEDFKVNVKLEGRKPIDNVFGIWKNQNIDIDKIREKAWQRTK